MRKILVFVLLTGILGSARANSGDSIKQKFLGFDANPLMSQVLPFNRISLDAKVFAITRRNYWGNNGVRTSYGLGLSDNLDLQFFQFMIGYDHRRSISHRWLYFAGVDFVLRSFSETPNGSGVVLSNTSGVGIGGHWGVEYKISPVVSFSTESNLQLIATTDVGGAAFILQPPLNLTAHFNITQAKKPRISKLNEVEQF